jgi:2-haloacid dehalogenase
MQPRACIFDAYGTLFDVHSVVERAGHGIPGDLHALSRLWRRKQIEYTWRRALMQRYADFRQVTEEALRSAASELGIEASAPQLAQLMEAYDSPLTFADVGAALEALQSRPLAILSNGTQRMLNAALRFHSLESRFAHVLSVDRVKTFKPSPLVYAMGPGALHMPAWEILFVSSNSWDVAGAKAYGYQVCWCNRSGESPDDLGFQADFTVSRLDQIAGRW